MKNIVLVALIVAGVIGFMTYSNQQKNGDQVKTEEKVEVTEKVSDAKDGDIIYYYGEECPHCHDVIKFLDENDIASKVDFAKKEVWHNKENQEKMLEKVAECGLDPETVGVPFLYAKGECLIGTPKVTGFFRVEAGI